MNQQQVLSVVRAFCLIIGTVLTTHGLITTAEWEPLAGAISMAAPVLWGVYAHTDANAVAVVDKMAKDPNSAVAAVLTTNTDAGHELAESIPGNTTVTAGSRAAAAITGAKT